MVISCVNVDSKDNISVPDSSKNNSVQKPCWLLKDIKECPEIEGNKQDHFFFNDIIVDNNTKKDDYKTLLLSKLKAQYVRDLHSDIRAFVFNSQKCKQIGSKRQCESIYQERIKIHSFGRIGPNEIILMDTYSEPLDNTRTTIHGFGKVSYDIYTTKLNTINDGIVLGLNNIKIQQPIIFPMPQRKSLNEPDECADINLRNFRDLEKPVDVLRSNIQTMMTYVDGIYVDDRVIEVNSEIRKNGLDTTNPKNFEMYENITQRTLEKMTRCYEKKVSELNASFIEKELSMTETLNQYNSDRTDFDNWMDEWKNYEDRIEKLKNEIDILKNIHTERLSLLSCSFLMFTYAYHKNEEYNKLWIKKHLNNIVINKLKEDAVIHHINEWIYMDETSFKIVHKDDVYYKFHQSTLDGIYLKPTSGNRGHIQKFNISLYPEKYVGGTSVSQSPLPFTVASNCGSDILIGIEDMKTLYSDVSKYDYTRIQHHIYKKLEARNNIIDFFLESKEKQEKLFRYADDVYHDNLQVLHDYYKMNEEYKQKMQLKNKKIKENESIINDLIVKAVSQVCQYQERSKDCLSDNFQSSSDFHEHQLVKQHREHLDKIITETKSKRAQLKKEKVFVRVETITKTEEIKHDQVARNVVTQYKDMLNKTCPVKGRETNVSVDHETTFNVQKHNKTLPIPLSYTIPAMRIKSIPDSDSKKYSLLLCLKLKCKDCSEDYQFDTDNNEIIDLKNNVRWEVVQNRIPGKRHALNDSYKIPEYSDYLNFCHGYNNYIETTNLLTNWPQINCLRRFGIEMKNDNTKIIIDRAKNESWTIYSINGQPMKYEIFRSRLRYTEWRSQSYAKVELFLNSLLNEFKQGKVEPEIVSYISNKRFWTSTMIIKRISTIYCDGKSVTEEKLEKKNKSFLGIVCKKNG